MNINQRIKELRKQLEYNQKDFGQKIGIGQAGVSKLEQDGNTVTNQNIRAICDTFNVSERWLRTGEGEMHVDSRRAYIKKLAQQYQVGDAHAGLIETFLSLTDAQRDNLLDILRQMVAAADTAEQNAAGDHFGGAAKMATIEKSSTVAPTNEDSSAVAPHLRDATKMVDIDKEVAAYRAELEAQQKGPSRSAGTADKRA